MNNKAIIEFGFRRIWRILQFSEGVIHLGLRPLWITLSLICRILHILLRRFRFFSLCHFLCRMLMYFATFRMLFHSLIICISYGIYLLSFHVHSVLVYRSCSFGSLNRISSIWNLSSLQKKVIKLLDLCETSLSLSEVGPLPLHILLSLIQ